MLTRVAIFILRTELIRNGEFFTFKNFADCEKKRMTFIRIQPAIWCTGMIKKMNTNAFFIRVNGSAIVVIHQVEFSIFFEPVLVFCMNDFPNVIADDGPGFNVNFGKDPPAFVARIAGFSDFPITLR